MKPTFVVESVMRWVKEIRKEVSQVVWSNGEKGDTYGGFYHFRQSGHG
jgi:preprotein translocase subunit SecE